MTRIRGVFCNRTLNFSAIKAIGYDMDYTLVHYNSGKWEETAYHHLKHNLKQFGWPLDGLKFDPDRVCRGLIIDTELGNLVKTNRFRLVKNAMHGTRPMDFSEQKKTYSRIMVDLSDSRWVFLNTLFSLSEACMFAQLVDLHDDQKLQNVAGYADLYKKVRVAIDTAHMEGRLKEEIINDKKKFVVLDEEAPLALLDQKHAGKKLLLITNSEWSYTNEIMSYAYDPFMRKGRTWRDFFDLIIVEARKPDFFTSGAPFFQIVSEDGLLRPHPGNFDGSKLYLGGSAGRLEKELSLSQDEILYVGDHMFGDVHVTKNMLRWRTALVLRELEGEIAAAEAFSKTQKELTALMSEKESLEKQLWSLKVRIQRSKAGYADSRGPVVDRDELGALKQKLMELDTRISPLAAQSGEVQNKQWGPLMRAGNDKSHFAFQIERYADIYTSRVSNFLFTTPFAYLRSPRGVLPHD
ncbi:MAG: HAD family hydrolase [Bdellovibrionales bacterium RIFOXYD1_FULL_53_11]|nr:MAG: HAD family hydrolase [Bdellovibrionales bacterium RIFOXYD1_FULL_53_11]